MSKKNAFRICYVGGGSRFVVTLLHGLAEQAKAVRELGRPIKLRLLDPAVRRAEEMAKYAQIVAEASDLPLEARVFDEPAKAVDGCDWVIFSPNLRDRSYRLFDELTQGYGKVEHESGPWTAVDAAVTWPVLRRIAGLMKERAPGATLTTLVNPTDVLAPAAEEAFGLPSHGMCVEVPNLRYFLSYYLQVPWEKVELKFVGNNHHGWVTQVTVDGRDGVEALLAVMDELPKRPDWHFGHDWFLKTLKRLRRMPTQNFHAWPTIAPDWEELAEERAAWQKRMGLDKETKDRQEVNVLEALAQGRMIEAFDPMKHTYGLTTYMYANMGSSFAGLAIGLAGGDGNAAVGTVSLQVRNGKSNAYLPEDVWVELPTVVREGKLEPQTVPAPPDWALGQIALIAKQRRMLAHWLATEDPKALAEALYMMPEAAHIDVLERMCDRLPGELRG
ncbi:MAG: hypothetical protein IT443_06135 [Phycisphaeraceae bacterium]|nr:hypothetical protein [Phycisphaeraceae bacterium]